MPSKPKVPSVYHFNFGLKQRCEPFHLIHYLCLESCIQVNRPEKVFFYYCNKPYGPYWDLIEEKLSLVKIEPVPEITNFTYRDTYIGKNFVYAHHSDFLRLKHLNEKGGVYADMDTLFVHPLSPELFKYSFVMGRESPCLDRKLGISTPSLCNAFIMAEKQSAFGAEYLKRMHAVFDGSWSKHSCELAWALSQEIPEHIHVEPEDSFFKYRSTPEGIEALLRGTEVDQKGVYSFHLWAHLWWSRWRKDFSTFHAGMMTEEFVRRVDTTYTIIARKFLPVRRRSFYYSLKSVLHRCRLLGYSPNSRIRHKQAL